MAMGSTPRNTPCSTEQLFCSFGNRLSPFVINPSDGYPEPGSLVEPGRNTNDVKQVQQTSDTCLK